MSVGAINARLLSAAELVRQGAVFADIGTDHAYLPLFLLDRGKISRAVCADINEGPLNSARANAREAGHTDKIEFVLTDGAACLSDRGITDYAICGMGGELIAAIIERAPHLRDKSVNLILQPMSRQGVLRKFLASNGFEIRCESYSTDSGKHYVTLLVNYTGNISEIDDVEAELGAKRAEYVNKSAQICYLKAKLSAFLKQRDGKIQGGDDAVKEALLVEKITERINSLTKE
jgi:tRNA (adenine22-N1)-methyltransferase